jgi:hypothetical protein
MPRGKARSKQRRAQDEIIWYALRVADWNFDYHFGLSASRWDAGPYSEHRHLELSGVPIRPSKLKAERAVLDVMADPQLTGHGKDSPKNLVGMLDLMEDTLRAHVWGPPDMLPLLVQLPSSRHQKARAIPQSAFAPPGRA